MVDLGPLEKKGWVKFPGNILEIDIAALSEEFEQYYNGKFRLDGYENVAKMGKTDIKKSDSIASIYEKVRVIIREINGDFLFQKLWLVKSTKHNIRADRVPFVPHIDNQRFLKAMIYLDDVSHEEGPLTIASADPDKFEALRKSFTADYKKKGQNIIQALDETDYFPCPGEAGTVIFFDTNTPHFAGKIRGDNNTRRVLRFDFHLDAWNKKSPARKVIDSIGNIFS